jgi:hypothetical protein
LLDLYEVIDLRDGNGLHLAPLRLGNHAAMVNNIDIGNLAKDVNIIYLAL